MRSDKRQVAHALACLIVLAGAPSAQVPNTPAGRQFSAWLGAFNSGDRDRIRKYIEANFPSANVDNQVRFRDRTGGFDLRRIEQATPTTLVGVIQERTWEQFARFSVTVNAAKPHSVARFVTTSPIPPEFASPQLPESLWRPNVRLWIRGWAEKRKRRSRSCRWRARDEWRLADLSQDRLRGRGAVEPRPTTATQVSGFLDLRLTGLPAPKRQE